jgi:hypothetical protein
MGRRRKSNRTFRPKKVKKKIKYKQAKLKSYEISKDGSAKKVYSNISPRIEWRALDFADEDGPFYHLPSDRPAARCML